jgi:hypothetical protein
MGTVYVRIDGKPANLVQLRDGQPCLDLYAPDDSFQERIPLATGLDYGLHTAELTIAADRLPASMGNNFAVDGLIVDRKVSSLRARAAMIGGTILLILVAIAMALFGRRIWRQNQA